ncbi:MAG: ABC transporter substrate-binding protein, partial [Akkermansia sp.]
MKYPKTILAALLCFIPLIPSCAPKEDHRVVRIGHSPNMTHVQALVARNMSRHGQGWFERYLPEQRVEWCLYNAGPSAMEAIFGRAVDLSYVGPSPAINAYDVSKGAELSLMAGAVDGGAALLVAPQSGINTPTDFKGKTIATPQLGNTQDVTCRAWLKAQGHSSTLEGKGDVRISPSPSSMQAQLMSDGYIHASWTVEPWVSIIQSKTGARVFLDEPDAVTTILVGRKAWLKQHPDLAKRMLQAHRELTEWIIANPEEAQRMMTDELSHLTQSPADLELIKQAWARLTLTTAIDTTQLEQFIKAAQALDLLGDVAPVQEMIYT